MTVELMKLDREGLIRNQRPKDHTGEERIRRIACPLGGNML